MSTLMARGMDMLNRSLGTAAAVAGVFTWPTSETTTITADDGVISGASSQSVLRPGQTEGNARLGVTERVLLVPADALTKNGVATEPVAGLNWTETINGVVRTFQLRPTSDDPGWDYSDPSGRSRYRLKLKRV